MYIKLFVPWVIFRIVTMWFRGIINIQYEFSFPFEELCQVDLRWCHSNVTAARRTAEDSDALIKNLTRLGVGVSCQGWNAGYLCLLLFSTFFFLWVCLSLVPLITSLRQQRPWLMMEIRLLVLGGASFYSVKHVSSKYKHLVICCKLRGLNQTWFLWTRWARTEIIFTFCFI